MLMVRNTKHLAGVEICGDGADLDALYLSLHTVVGDEGEFLPFDGARLRVLGVCYELRHAFQADREFEFMENGFHEDQMKRVGLIAPQHNLYYACRIYYPEALFVTMALNDFVRLYAQKQTKFGHDLPLLHRDNVWNPTVAMVRLFQAGVVESMNDAVTDATFRRLMNLMYRQDMWTSDFMTQYLDVLTIRYLKLNDRDKRQRALLTTVKRLVEPVPEYREFEAQVKAMAKARQCAVEDIQLVDDYPAVDW